MSVRAGGGRAPLPFIRHKGGVYLECDLPRHKDVRIFSKALRELLVAAVHQKLVTREALVQEYGYPERMVRAWFPEQGEGDPEASPSQMCRVLRRPSGASMNVPLEQKRMRMVVFTTALSEHLQVGDVEIGLGRADRSYVIKVAGQTVVLPPKPHQLLRFLMQRYLERAGPISTRDLLRALWSNQDPLPVLQIVNTTRMRLLESLSESTRVSIVLRKGRVWLEVDTQQSPP